MVDSPHIWGIGDDIIIDLFVGDPNTGLGLTGKSGSITLTIEKRSIGQFFNGTDYSALTPFALTMTEVSAADSPGRYRFTLPGSANIEKDEYYTHASISDFPTVEGDDYAIHAVRDNEVRIYESEPIVVQ